MSQPTETEGRVLATSNYLTSIRNVCNKLYQLF